MNAGRKNSKPNIGIHGHAGGTRPGQTRKTPKNLSAHGSEERGREESVGFRNSISAVIDTSVSQR